MMHSNESRCPGRRFWKIPFIFAAIVLIKSGIVLLLWNAVIPDLFQLSALTYPQAIGLTVLAKLLFGAGGPRHGFGPPFGHLRARMAGLSQEDRDKLREELRNRCCS